jgi:hypothetical protein
VCQGSFLSDWTQVVDAADDAAVIQPPVHDMVFFADAIGNFMADLKRAKSIGNGSLSNTRERQG